MSTLARLYFSFPNQHREAFEAGFNSRLKPILDRHGIVPVEDKNRPIAQREDRFGRFFFSMLFEVDGLAAIAARDTALRRDPDWRQAIQNFGDMIGDYEIGLYRTRASAGPSITAGPGTSSKIGSGTRRRVGQGFWQGAWQSYSLADGMPKIIADIVQHPDGDLFFSTHDYANGRGGGNGLYRFDGVNLHHWGTADGLASDQVICLCCDGSGNLFFGSKDRGLSRWDGERLTTFTTKDGLPDNTVTALLIDHRGALWLGGPCGLCRWDGRGFTTYPDVYGHPHKSRIARLFEDSQGRLWFGGGWYEKSDRGLGLGCFDGKSITRFTEAEGLPMNWILSLAEDSQGRIFFGHSDGLGSFDGERFSRISTTTKHAYLGGVTALATANQKSRFFFSVWGEGIRHWEGKESSAPLTPENGLTGSNIHSLLCDRSNQVWVGTEGAGLSRFNGQQLEIFGTESGLPHPVAVHFSTDLQGRLWIATTLGLSVFVGGRFISLESVNAVAGSIMHDKEGHLWFGSPYKGIGCWDGQQVEHLDLSENPNSDGLGAPIVPLLEDSKGRLFIAGGGLDKMHLLDRRKAKKGKAVFNTDLKQDTSRIRCALEDRQGRLFFGGDDGLSLLDGAQLRHFEAKSLGGAPVNALLQDRQDRLWIATGNGLARWNNGTIHRFDVNDGLADNEITALLEDERGHLWVATAAGVNTYDGLVFQHLSRRDGLPADYIRNLHKDREGALWIATSNGLVRYRPAAHPPVVRIQGLVADREYAPDAEIVIHLSQSLLAFEFQGFSLSTQPDRMAYCCRIQGYDTTWRPLYTPRAEYRDLPEGDYVFEVRAIDRDLNYSAVDRLSFSIEPDPRLQGLSAALSQSGPHGEFVGRSPTLQKVQHQLRQIAPADTTVLILGETGTGKGLAARTLHRLSPRRDAPFIVFTCGGQPESLLESELFGHEKGAFTGATARRLGKVELARNGTLFLDEIGDLPAAGQLKLLRLLEERTFERVGGNQELHAEIRIITATNRDLRQQIAQGAFREDLYFRLRGFEISLPPLRRRKEDIPLLALHFIGTKATHLDKQVAGLAPSAQDALLAYDWPGNIRELQHAIETAVVVCQSDTIQTVDLHLGHVPPGPPPQDSSSGYTSLEDNERHHISAVLRATRWRISGPKGAAKILGLPESSLRYRIKKLGIKRS